LTFFVALVVAVRSLKLSLDVQAGERPITKVVKLLEGMKEQLDKEAQEEADLMEKYTCWCNENGADKATAVEKFVTALKTMESRIAELSATSARLKIEYTNLAKDVVKDEAAMDKAMAIRRKEVDKYDAEKDDLEKILASVNKSQEILVPGTGFMQVQEGSGREALRSLVQQVVSEHAAELDDKGLKNAYGFLQTGNPVTDSLTGMLDGYEMKFTMSLRQLEETEAKAKTAYEKLIKAKRTEIDTAKVQIATKKEQKTTADEEMMHTKQDVKDAKSSMESDIAFAQEVKAKCDTKQKDWEKRQKTRAEETEAVAKAIGVLASDDAHETFGKTMSLIQVSQSEAASRQLVSQTLSKAGQTHKDARLVTLAMEAKLDGFTRVQEKIKLMASALKKEQADEVEKKGWCIEELQKNKLAKEKKARKNKALGAKKDALAMLLEGARDTVSDMKADVAEMKKQQKVAAQNRESENAEFQKNVQEQRQTQVLLKKAMSVLGEFYNEKQEALIQAREVPKEPTTFRSYKRSSSSNGVMLMLQRLIADAVEMEKESVAAERESQSDYEDFGKEVAQDLKSKTKAIATKAGEMAKAEQESLEARESAETLEAQVEALTNTEFTLHESCDFTLQNFDARQKARTSEIEALAQAKSYLNGAK